MRITFLGQLGLPRIQERDASATPNRVEAVARELVLDGHDVTVFGTAPYLSSGNYHGINLKQIPSLNPQQPGGWTYLVFCLISLLRHPVDVIQVHGWQAAFLLSLTHWLFRDARLIWTIDTIPKSNIESRILNIASRFATITTPLRTIQYQLLVNHNIRVVYIPDGYRVPTVADIAVTRFGLKKNSYVVALVSSPAALRHVAKAYAASKTRKKLVVLQAEDGVYKRLKKKYSFIKFVGNSDYSLLTIPSVGGTLLAAVASYKLSGRSRRSIVANAAAVIIGDDSISSTVLLEAMHAKRAIIASNEPRYQEILGVTGQYFVAQDSQGLAAELTSILTDAKAQTIWGQLASKRANRHFTWPRIMEDYHTLYAPIVRVIPLDSAYLVHYSPSKVL